MPTSLLKVLYGPRSLVYAIHLLRIESPEEAYRLLIHGEYQRVRRYRPYRRDAPTPVQAPVPLPPVHVGEHVRERPRRVRLIRAHLAPHRIGGVEGRPVRDAGRGAPEHVVRHGQVALRPALGYLEFAHGLVGAVPTKLARMQACKPDRNRWTIDVFVSFVSKHDK